MIIHTIFHLQFSRLTAQEKNTEQRWSLGHKARGQDQGHKKNPRPKTALPRTDPLEAKDRNARGQGLEPRTQAQVFSKKKVSKKFFQAISKKKTSSKFFFVRSPKAEYKKGLRKFSARFLAFSNEILRAQKIVLSSSRRQGDFRGFEASRPRPSTSNCVLEAKDVLKDSTSETECGFKFQYRKKSINVLFFFSSIPLIQSGIDEATSHHLAVSPLGGPPRPSSREDEILNVP